MLGLAIYIDIFEGGRADAMIEYCPIVHIIPKLSTLAKRTVFRFLDIEIKRKMCSVVGVFNCYLIFFSQACALLNILVFSS